jgi:TPR repeat protein
MASRCAACGSLNVRRSTLRPSELSDRPRFRSPYRCRDCGERFWVLSRRTNYVAWLGAIVIAVAAIGWNVFEAPGAASNEPERATASEAGFRETLSRAEHGDSAAELELYRLYGHGIGVERSKQEAHSWLERAALHGNTDAQFELGNALRQGTGVVQDYQLAAKWLELAAENGNADAQYALGQMYRSGVGIGPDNAKAYIWFNLAAAQDVAGAALQRDAALRALAPEQIVEAQAEARRLSDATAAKQTATAH